MTQLQAQLDLFAPPAPPAGEIDRLLEYLAARPEWIPAKQLLADLGFSDRKVRQLAEQSEARIISYPGSPGYRHFHHCTTDELAHAADAHISQGRRQIARGLRIRKRAHETIR
jgi:hypothetical protein